MDDMQEQKLYDRRSAHLSAPGSQNEYAPHQQIWFTEDNSAEWKRRLIESKRQYPDSYWVTTANNAWRLRRNVHDLKPRFSLADFQPSFNTVQHSPTTPTVSQEVEKGQIFNVPTPKVLGANPVSSTQKMLHETPMNRKADHSRISVKDESISLPPSPIQNHSPVKIRSGRQMKQNRSLDFVYLSKYDHNDSIS